MKKLFYRLSSSRSFAKLFSLLACVALGSMFAQQAVAQEFEFGWEPFPPSSWDGGWDASLSCKAFDSGNGTTALTLTPPTVVQDGKVSCTFTDPARTPTSSPSCGSFCVDIPNDDKGPVYQETATCKLSFDWSNLEAECANNNGSSTLTVTGQCPFKNGYTTVGATLEGTIDCRGRNPNGTVNTDNNPQFCLYAGNDPFGNESETKDCQWRLGFGAKNNYGNVVPLTQQQCNDFFGDSPQLFSFTQTPTVFSATYTFAGPACTGKFEGVGPTTTKFCHNDTWDGSQKAFCNHPPTSTATTGTSSVQSFLTPDTEYTPETINAKCTPNNNGVVTLRVLANNVDPDTHSVAVEEIDQDTITVNGRKIIPGSCNLTNKDTVLQCKVNRCQGGVSIVDNTGTLTMEALMNDGTPLVGDIETKKVVH